jgi:hypothetical protein
MLLMNGCIGVDGHGPEFQAKESFAHVTNALLLEKDRAGGNDFNESADEQPRRHPQNRRDKNTSDIKGALP